MVQVKAAESSVKTLQQKLIESDNASTKYYDELGMIINSFAIFKSSLQDSIQNFTKHDDKIEASNLGGTSRVTGIPAQMILERNV